MARTLVSLVFVLVVSGLGQAQSNPRPATDDEILLALIPNENWAGGENLKQFTRADEIRALRKALPTATGERRNSIIWLLAVLKYRYAENRSHVVKLFTRCRAQAYPMEMMCYDQQADRLEELIRRGDYSLLKYLFEIWPKSDGGLAEGLGTFFSDILVSHPRGLLEELQRRGSLKEQQAICTAAAIEDGSGMNRQRLSDTRRILSSQIKKRDRLSPVARICLNQINAARKEMANRQ